MKTIRLFGSFSIKIRNIYITRLYIFGDIYIIRLYIFGDIYIIRLYIFGDIYIIRLYIFGDISLNNKMKNKIPHCRNINLKQSLKTDQQ
jgi:hypothetical protein